LALSSASSAAWSTWGGSGDEISGLVLFIYAALGVQIFAKFKMGPPVTPGANFLSLSRAMVMLMRCDTG
jgi:hypothetical protein